MPESLTLIKEIIEFIVLFAEIFMLLKPEKPSNLINVNKTQHYYFPSKNISKKFTDNEIFIIVITIVFSYFMYSLFNQYLSLFLIILIMLLVLKYTALKINYRKQLLLPIFIAVLFFLTNFQSEASRNYWIINNKIDLAQLNGFKKINIQLTNTLPQIFELIKDALFKQNPTSISVLATFIFVTLSVFYIGKLLLQSKEKIKITKLSSIIIKMVLLTIVTIFMFYDYPQNPLRILTYYISYFFNN